MSFGFGFSDFITVIQLANKVRKEFVDAPRQFKAISDELRGLSIILNDVEISSEQGLSSEQTKALDDIGTGCRNVLEEVKKTLEDYRDLQPGCNSAGRKIKRAWKRLQWEPDNIRELRSRITSHIVLLSNFQGSLASQTFHETKAGVDRLNERQDNQERETILNWLTPIDYTLQQVDFINRRQEGTGQWLLTSPEFKKWLETKKQTLFCPGIPGAGKTFLTAVVVDDLNARFSEDPTIGIAYVYCDFRRKDEQQANDLLASLLKQILTSQIPLPANVTDPFNTHREKGTRPSLDEISRILQSATAMYSRVFIVVDALDECEASHSNRSRFLSELFNLQTRCGANVLATSRFIPEIIYWFKGSMSLEIRASNEDVQTYLQGHLEELPAFVQKNSQLREEIKIAISDAVDGMFLLAHIYLGSLDDKPTAKAVRKALKEFNKQTAESSEDQKVQVLAQAYAKAMERINGQKFGLRELAMKVLSWITCARRPLRTAELQEALAVDVGDSELDRDNLPEIELMVSVCVGLVTVDKESDIIRLVHFTTQEYFEQTQQDWFPNAQSKLTTTCVSYLSFDVFDNGACRTDRRFVQRLQSNKLYDYASKNWGYHACAASISYPDIEEFLSKEAQIEASSQVLLIPPSSWGEYYSQRFPKQLTAFHLLAYFGVKEAISYLVKGSLPPDSKDSRCRTPLSYAAKNGHEDVVKLLLATGQVQPDSKDHVHRTPLSYAAGSGHETIVKLLLATGQVEPNSKDDTGWIPLLYAASNGHETIVKLLLATGQVEPDSKDHAHQTPLSYAAENGHETIVKLLLATGQVEPDSKDDTGWTPLLYAASNGHETIVKLLLATGQVEPNSKDDTGWIPLLYAASNGHETIVKLLLATGQVEPDSKDHAHQTPLSYAAENGHETIVKLLLATGQVEPNSKDDAHRTPLSYAAENGHETIVKLLLATGQVEPNSKDHVHRTPLSYAAGSGHETIVKLLLATGQVEPDSKDDRGWTPLLYAAENGRETIVKLLLATRQVEPDSKGYYAHRTPLSYAAENGYETIVKLLLATGQVDLDSKNSRTWKNPGGWTPLSFAARNGHETIVKLLATKQAQVKQCLDHNTSDSPSMYSDHVCSPEDFPSRTWLQLDDHTDELRHVRFSPDGTKLATASSDRSVYIYETTTFQVLHKLESHRGEVMSVAWSPDSTKLISCSIDTNPLVWDVASGIIIMTAKHRPIRGGLPTAAWLPDSQSFVTSSKGWVFRWIMRHPEAKMPIPEEKLDFAGSECAITPDGQRLVLIARSNWLYVIDMRTSQEEYRTWFPTGKLTGLTVSRDSLTAIVNLAGREPGEMQLMKLATGETLRSFKGQAQSEFMIGNCFGGAKENFILNGSEDGKVYVWHRECGSLVKTLSGHEVGARGTRCVRTVSWNPCHPGMFASGGDDGKVRIWTNDPPTE